MKYLAPCSSILIPAIPALALACAGGGSPSPRAPRSEMPSVTTTTGGEAPRPSLAHGSTEPGSEGYASAQPQAPAPGLSRTHAPADSVRTGGLTDDQIVQIAHVIHTAEVDQARVARARAKDERVKRFSTMMITDHMEADGRGYELAKRSRLAPSESATSQALKEDSERTIEELQQAGAGFDRVYMAEQVRAHRAVLETLDNQLLPAAKNDDVKSMLKSIRAQVEAHMRSAHEIQDALNTGGAKRRGVIR